MGPTQGPYILPLCMGLSYVSGVWPLLTPLFRTLAADILNFTIVTLIWPVPIRLPNVTQISSLATEIWPRDKIEDGCRRHLELPPIFWASGIPKFTVVLYYIISNAIYTMWEVELRVDPEAGVHGGHVLFWYEPMHSMYWRPDNVRGYRSVLSTE